MIFHCSLWASSDYSCALLTRVFALFNETLMVRCAFHIDLTDSRIARAWMSLLFLALLLHPNATSGQQTTRAALGDSVIALSKSLSAEGQQIFARYLEANPSDAYMRMYELSGDTTASALVFAVLAKEPRADVRAGIARWIARRDHLARNPKAVPALLERIRMDPDSEVVVDASKTLNKLGTLQVGLRDAVRDRIASARAGNDTSLLRISLQEDEDMVYAGEGILAPRYMLAAEGPFVAAPATKPIRVVAFGDYGVNHMGDPNRRWHQAMIAKVLSSYSKKHPITFGITTGDNFYPTSFGSPDDPNWKTSWSELYDRLGYPFYVSLGNHDWGNEAGPLSHNIYARNSKSWKFPGFYYTYTAGPVQFFAINTNALTERHVEWLKRELAKSTAKWKVVYGHFPVYEQDNYTLETTPPTLEPIFKQYGVDMYLCGHHHSMQHWSIDGIDYVVTGAGGAGTYAFRDSTDVRAGRKFAQAVPGFAILEANQSELKLKFIGQRENVLYEYIRKK
jgi:tartrate-resistant acid phosphatase type 5